MFRVMALKLWRDPAGLFLAFCLPPLVFIVFASVFASSASGHLEIKAGIHLETPNQAGQLLQSALSRRLNGRLVSYPTSVGLRQAVMDGRVDAGVEVRSDPLLTPSPALVIIHPGRRGAGEILTAQTDAAAASSLGPAAADGLTEQLKIRLALSPAQSRLVDQSSLFQPKAPFALQDVLAGGDPLVVYYAGAVSILFLMFGAMQGSLSLIDERAAGLRLRLGLSADGVGPLLGGRMLWLSGVGVGQALVLFLVAQVIYQVPVIENFLPWSVTAAAAAAAAAGIALALASACDTREQAQTLSTFAVLILAAVGGSMAPRYLMPAFLQQLGWLTPHTWVIETYQTVLWRRIISTSVLEGWAALWAFASFGFLLAFFLERRRRL